MIISKLQGGLGNQLFQYSLGRNLAIKNNSQLKLDLSWYDLDFAADRPYELANFNIEATIASPEEVQELTNWKVRAKNLLNPGESRVINEPSLKFNPSVLEAKDPSYLVGFWQSEKYFQGNEKAIRHDLTFKDPPLEQNVEVLSEIKASTAVAVHVRRGDYITKKSANSFHGTCSIEYYQEAAKEIAQSVKNPHFFLFSDDPVWVKENLILPFPSTYVKNNSDKATEDLRLMSECKHFIVANSTFSWWGAWLSDYSEKKIIAPKQWFRNKSASAQDLVPSQWQRL